MTADDDLCRRILGRLEVSREIDPVDLDVAVADGIVTVSGEVGSFAERLAVLSVVRADPETVAVVDELRVAPLPGEWHLRDDEIVALVTERLRQHPELTAVVPSCGSHVVSLDGVVATADDRRRAHHLARTTLGVHFVIDRIEAASHAASAKA